MKRLALILALASSAYAINPFSYNWTIKLTGDTATVGKWKANNDSVLNWATRISDTLTNQVYRKADRVDPKSILDTTKNLVGFPNGRIDSTFTMDSLYSRAVKISGNVSGNIGTFTSTVNVDSLHSTKGLTATNGTFSTNLGVTGKITCDTLVGPIVVDSLRSNGVVRVDSLYSTKGIKATTFTGALAGNVTGATGTFTTGITLANGTQLTTYKDTAFACSLFDGSTYRATGTGEAVITGGQVQMVIPSMTGTITGTTTIHLPARFKTVHQIFVMVTIYNNSTVAVGQIDTQTFTLTTLANSSLTAGTGGLPLAIHLGYILESLL